jgi:predicted DNA-binding protein YlxM (UPF0122 family)
MLVKIQKPPINYSRICLDLLGYLPDRQKMVVGNRFGLLGKDPQTLQEIGDYFGITRERVRQIEKEGLSHLAQYQSKKELQQITSFFNEYFKEQGGAKREDLALADLSVQEDWRNQVYFLLVLADPFHRIPENENIYSFWTLEEKILDKFLPILEKTESFFKTENKLLSQEDILLMTQGELANFVFSALEIAKNIERGPLGFFGLADWPEIKPKGVKDMALLALKKHKQPLHFREIAQIANQLLQGKSFRKVLPQTLHNELIRDKRFVLVGRGIYALKEWGYNNGTVRDIITDLIKGSGGGLFKDEIVKGVLDQRLVKSNTILLNLHNKKHFLRTGEGKYIVSQ